MKIVARRIGEQEPIRFQARHRKIILSIPEAGSWSSHGSALKGQHSITRKSRVYQGS
jgi:hypothetical protein